MTELNLVEMEKNIPFIKGYHLFSNTNIPQEVLKFRRSGMESWVKNFNGVEKISALVNFIKDDDFVLNFDVSYPSLVDLIKFPMFDIEAYTCVIFNGKYVPELSDNDDVDVSELLDDEKNFAELRSDVNPFIALNSAYLSSGVVIKIKDGKKVKKPIHIISLVSSAKDKIFVNPRVLVMVGDNAFVDVIESNLSFDDETYFENKVCEFYVGKNSVVNNYKFYDVSKKSFCMENDFVNLDDGSSFNQVCFAKKVGGLNLLNNYSVSAGTELNSSSSFDTEKGSDVYVQSVINHKCSDAKSNVALYAVARENAKVMFKTDVVCYKNISGVNTSQLSRILLASKDASGYVKPFQNIASEKVNAFHGAVVSGVQSRDLFFLESRGIDTELAKEMMYNACLASVVDNVKDEKFRKEFLKLLALK